MMLQKLAAFLKENNFFEVDEIRNYFNNTLNRGIIILKNKYGSKCAISIIMVEKTMIFCIHCTFKLLRAQDIFLIQVMHKLVIY